MSASERLKALVPTVYENAPAWWSIEEDPLGGSLPELIAVVKAAEQIERGPIFVGSRLGDELAALDAKLTTEEKR